MASDEEAIRQLVRTWLEASRVHDVDVLLGLLTEDVLFLIPGQPPMRKRDFEAASRVPPGRIPPTIEATSDIQEIVVSGDWAFLWQKLAVAITTHDGSTTRRAGHTLTVLKKQGGKWLLARDANILAPVEAGAAVAKSNDTGTEGRLGLQ